MGQLIPLSIKGEENFRLGESEPTSWEVLVQKRLKNGRPQTFVPEPCDVELADPLLMIHRTGVECPDLFVGFLSYDLHLAELEIKFGGSSKAEFASLAAVSNFENTELPDRGQRTSQWVLLTTGNDAADMLFNYGELVGTYHSIAPPSLQRLLFTVPGITTHNTIMKLFLTRISRLLVRPNFPSMFF